MTRNQAKPPDARPPSSYPPPRQALIDIICVMPRSTQVYSETERKYYPRNEKVRAQNCNLSILTSLEIEPEKGVFFLRPFQLLRTQARQNRLVKTRPNSSERLVNSLTPKKTGAASFEKHAHD